ncbi:MAG: DinB family protein, partial [Gemmatimonadaceae bacterium]
SFSPEVSIVSASSHAAALRRPGRFLALVAAATALSLGLTTAARAQAVLDVKSANEVLNRYVVDLDTLHSKVMQLANAIPAEKYSWRPAAGVRSISEALMHIATEWYFYTPQSVGMKAPADFGKPEETIAKMEKVATKAEVLDHLKKSWTHCHEQLKAADASKLTGKYKPWDATLPEAAFGMSGDLHEHLGQMIAYARSVGVKPPWTK